MATNPDPEYVYAVSTCVGDTADGIPVALRRGDVWLASDPYVLERGDLFVAEAADVGPDFPRRTVAAADVPPEQPKTRRGRRR